MYLYAISIQATSIINAVTAIADSRPCMVTAPLLATTIDALSKGRSYYC